MPTQDSTNHSGGISTRRASDKSGVKGVSVRVSAEQILLCFIVK